MAPAVARTDRLASLPAALPPPPDEAVALLPPEAEEFRRKLVALREHLIKNSSYVGRGFADEARKMHFGEIEHRTIHGEASREEVRDLLEDGVPIAPLPVLPDERN